MRAFEIRRSQRDFPLQQEGRLGLAGGVRRAGARVGRLLFPDGPRRAQDQADVLLFLDEIQATPSAFAALRYLHEELPRLAMVAAGIGWTILTPLAIRAAPRFHPDVEVRPLPFAPPGATNCLRSSPPATSKSASTSMLHARSASISTAQKRWLPR